MATLTVTATPIPVSSDSDSTSAVTTTTLTSSTIANPEFLKWYQQDQLVVSYITSTLTEPVLALTVVYDSAQAIWNCLQRRFAHFSVTNSATFRYQLLDLTKGSRLVADYLQQAKSLADKLANIGRPVDPEDFITTVLRGLGPEYLMLTTAVINVTPLPTFEELHSKIMAFDLQNPRSSTTPAAAFQTALITTQAPRGTPQTNSRNRGNNWNGNRGNFNRQNNNGGYHRQNNNGHPSG